MSDVTKFRAPWGISVMSTTGLVAVLFASPSLIFLVSGLLNDGPWPFLAICIICSGSVMACLFALFAYLLRIQGYVLTPDEILVQRPWRESKVSLTGLVSVEVDAWAMLKSSRICGNKGMFCFSGEFKNETLGAYHAFATDPKRSVILRFPNRTVVFTPDRPEEFAARIEETIAQRATDCELVEEEECTG